ncbi:MAG: MmgE/PrpD family protein, partial [Chloroflexota bacterium]|nr:MmgE/PrpD family protein [Chloroflexota bacterium]
MSTDPMGLTRRLAAFAAGLRYEDLPPEVADAVKRIALDTVGTALAATALGDGCAEASAVARGAGGAAEASLIGYGVKAPALTAAFVNGATSHALNYDPLGGSGGHLGVSTLPSTLAAAERRRSVGGAEFVAA